MAKVLASLLSDLSDEIDETVTSGDVYHLSHFKKGHSLYIWLNGTDHSKYDPFSDLNDAFVRLDAVACWTDFELWANSLLNSKSVDMTELSWKLLDDRPKAVCSDALIWAKGFVACRTIFPHL